MNKEFIARHWYANVYEQFENDTYDVKFLLNVLKNQTDGMSQNILEIACGGGRISIPLAKAGHLVTGFDADEHMLLRCYQRMAGMPNIHIYQADATKNDWSCDFDVVVMAGNLLINIESEMDYAGAQRLLIQKAADALKAGGHFYLDFDLYADPASVFNRLKENSYFDGTDDLGTIGKTISYGSVYDPVTQICTGTNHWELTLNNEETCIFPKRWYKHIPTQAQVYQWLCDAGFEIERTYLNYTDETVPEPIDSRTQHVTIWAKKLK